MAQSTLSDSLLGIIDDIINDESVVIYSIEEEAREEDDTANKSDLHDDLYFRIQQAGDRLVSNASLTILLNASWELKLIVTKKCHISIFAVHL